MAIGAGNTIRADDFVDESERDATPENDSGRVPKFESDGRIHPFFTRNGDVLNAGETINGATLPVPVYQNKTDNELYACDANDNTKYKFIGFAVSNSTDGNPIAFQSHGVVNGFSGLAEGEKYYVQDTAGTIGTTPGTQHILVGVAISTTALLIQKGIHRAAGVYTTAHSSDATATLTVGFRPAKVTLHVYILATGGDLNIGTLVFVNGLNYAANSANDGTSIEIPTTYTNEIELVENATDKMRVTVLNITDTTFDIFFNNITSFNNATTRIVWEAEGEL